MEKESNSVVKWSEDGKNNIDTAEECYFYYLSYLMHLIGHDKNGAYYDNIPY